MVDFKSFTVFTLLPTIINTPVLRPPFSVVPYWLLRTTSIISYWHSSRVWYQYHSLVIGISGIRVGPGKVSVLVDITDFEKVVSVKMSQRFPSLCYLLFSFFFFFFSVFYFYFLFSIFFFLFSLLTFLFPLFFPFFSVCLEPNFSRSTFPPLPLTFASPVRGLNWIPGVAMRGGNFFEKLNNWQTGYLFEIDNTGVPSVPRSRGMFRWVS